MKLRTMMIGAGTALSLLSVSAAAPVYAATNVRTAEEAKSSLSAVGLATEVLVGADASATVDVNANTNPLSKDADSDGPDGQADTASLIFVRADIGTSTPADDEETSYASVATKSDLSAYAANLLRSDAHLEGTVLSSSAVSVDYDEPVKLLWFIPSTVTAHVEVKNDGTVSVDYPWYDFVLAHAQNTDLEARIRAATQDVVGVENTTSVSLSASQQASVLAKVHQILKSGYAADTEASVSASAGAKTR